MQIYKLTRNLLWVAVEMKISPVIMMAQGSRRTWYGSVDPLTSISRATTSVTLPPACKG